VPPRPRIPVPTTSIPPAYLPAPQGRRDLEHRSAEDLFRRALEEDPGFARAPGRNVRDCDHSFRRDQRDRPGIRGRVCPCRQRWRTDPSLKETELALGRLYLASGRPEQAEAVFRSLLRRSPRDALVHIGLGRALAKSNRPDAGAELPRRPSPSSPASGSPQLPRHVPVPGLPESRGCRGLPARDRARARQPHVYNNLGAALLAAGDLQQAAAAFERSIQIEPSRGAYSNLGTLYYYLGRFENAVEAYTKAIELAPEDHRLWGGRGRRRVVPAAGAHGGAPGLPARGDCSRRRRSRWTRPMRKPGRCSATSTAASTTRTGRERYLARALELGPDQSFVAYLAAVAAADRGDRPEAHGLIRHAIDNGISSGRSPGPIRR